MKALVFVTVVLILCCCAIIAVVRLPAEWEWMKLNRYLKQRGR